MKKLFMVLAVASMFIASSAFAAVINYDCFKANEFLVPATMGDFTMSLSIDTDAGTMTMGDGVYEGTVGVDQGYFTGGTLNIASDAGGVYTSEAYSWPGGVLDGPYASSYIGVIMTSTYELFVGNFVYDTNTDEGSFACMPWDSALHYAWGFTGTLVEDVPIPGAAWLLLSGLVGIVALRRIS